MTGSSDFSPNLLNQRKRSLLGNRASLQVCPQAVQLCAFLWDGCLRYLPGRVGSLDRRVLRKSAAA